MQALILGVAVLCYAVSLAVVAAGMRLPVAQPAGTVAAPTAAVPAAQALLSPPGQLQSTVDDLAREQAANRALVSELRATVEHLQAEIAGRSAALYGEGQKGRTVTVLCCDLLPPGQVTLGAGAGDMLRSILPELQVDTRQLVSVEGHTDSRPILSPADKPFKDNADLSLLRARAVAALLKRYGVAPARIRVKGWGDTRPLATNDTAEGRDRNRRVEVRLLPPSPEL